MTRQVYLAITIDTECDKGPRWRIQRPLRFRSVLEGIPERLEPLFHEVGVRATYLLSPEVMRETRCVAVMKEVEDRGAELGTHLHGEFIEPCPRVEADATWDMQKIYPAGLEAEKLKNLTALFTDRFGHPPVSFRAGRFGIGKNSLPILSRIGYRVDSSVAPYARWRDRGGEVSFFGVPTQPYFPSTNDPLRAGNLPILEVPITVRAGCWEKLPKGLVRTFPRIPRLWAIPIRLWPDAFRIRWLRPTTTSFEEMRMVLSPHLTGRYRRRSALVMIFHNVEVVPGCSPYTQNASDVKSLESRLRRILAFAAERGVRFATLADLGEVFSQTRFRNGPSA